MILAPASMPPFACEYSTLLSVGSQQGCAQEGYSHHSWPRDYRQTLGQLGAEGGLQVHQGPGGCCS